MHFRKERMFPNKKNLKTYIFRLLAFNNIQIIPFIEFNEIHSSYNALL